MSEDPEAEATCLAWLKQRSEDVIDVSERERDPEARSYKGNLPYAYMGLIYPPDLTEPPNGPTATEVVSVALEHFHSPRALAALLVRELQCSERPEATALAVWALKKKTLLV